MSYYIEACGFMKGSSNTGFSTEEKWPFHARRHGHQSRRLMHNKTFIKAFALMFGSAFLLEVTDMMRFEKLSQFLHRTLERDVCAGLSTASERRENALRESLGFLSQKRRILCEYFWDHQFGKEVWEHHWPPAKNGIYGPPGGTPLPSGSIAYVVTLTHCPADTNKPGIDNIHDPGSTMYESSALLHFSTCNSTNDEDKTKSKYNFTMYAVVHSEAVLCAGPNNVKYDRVKLLQELGYWVLIYNEPVAKSNIVGSSFLKDNIEEDVGIRDLMKLHAFKLTNHPLVVMVDFETLVMQPLDDVFDALLDTNSSTSHNKAMTTPVSGTDKGVSTGMLVLKPSFTDYNNLLSTFVNTAYTNTTGWGGSGITGFPGEMGMAGLLAYYYSQPANPAMPMNRCIYNNGNEAECAGTQEVDVKVNRMRSEICGKPMDCNGGGSWDALTKYFCHSNHRQLLQYRVEYELEHWDIGVLNARDGHFLPNIFLGYCAAEGPSGYIQMIGNNAFLPTDSVINPYCAVTCPTGSYVKPDCSCTPTSAPCQACPRGFRCQSPQPGVPLMCIDCTCGYCNKESKPCCGWNGVDKCMAATQDPECNIENHFFPQLNGTGNACELGALLHIYEPNSCGCQPTQSTPCVYDPANRTPQDQCYVCDAISLVDTLSLNLGICSDCLECLKLCDPCVEAVVTAEDMEVCLGGSTMNHACRRNCDVSCRKL